MLITYCNYNCIYIYVYIHCFPMFVDVRSLIYKDMIMTKSRVWCLSSVRPGGHI